MFGINSALVISNCVFTTEIIFSETNASAESFNAKIKAFRSQIPVDPL